MQLIIIIFIIILVLLFVALLVYFLVIRKKDDPDPNSDPTTTIPDFTFPNEFKTKILNYTWDTNTLLTKKYVFLSFNKDSGTINNKTISGISNHIETDYFTGVGQAYHFDDTFPTNTFQAITIPTEENITLTENTDGWLVSITNPINKYFIGLLSTRKTSDNIIWDSTLQKFNDPTVGYNLSEEYAACHYSNSKSIWFNHGIRIDRYNVVLFNPLHDNIIKTNASTIYKSYYNIDNKNWIPDPDHLNSLKSITTSGKFTYTTPFTSTTNVDLYDPNSGEGQFDVVNQISDEVLSGKYILDGTNITIKDIPTNNKPWFYDSDNFILDPSIYICLGDIDAANLTNTKGVISGNVLSFELSSTQYAYPPLDSIGNITNNTITINRKIWEITNCCFNNIKSFSIDDKQYVFTFNDKINLLGEYTSNISYTMTIGTSDGINYRVGHNDIPVTFNGSMDNIKNVTFKQKTGNDWSVDSLTIDTFTSPSNLHMVFDTSTVSSVVLDYSDNYRTGLTTPSIPCNNLTYDLALGTVISNKCYYYYNQGKVSIPFTIIGSHPGVTSITFPAQKGKDNKYEIESETTVNLTPPQTIEVKINSDIDKIQLSFHDNIAEDNRNTLDCIVYTPYTLTLGDSNKIYCANESNDILVTVGGTIPPIANLQFKQQSGTNLSIDKQYIVDNKINMTISDIPETPINITYNDAISGDHTIENVVLKYINYHIELGTDNKYKTYLGTVRNIPFKIAGSTNNINGFTFLANNDDPNYTIVEQPKTITDTTVGVTFKQLPIDEFTLQYTDDNLGRKYETIPCKVSKTQESFDINLGYLLDEVYYCYYTKDKITIPFTLSTSYSDITVISFIEYPGNNIYSVDSQTRNIGDGVEVHILADLTTLSLLYKDPNDINNNTNTKPCTMRPMYNMIINDNKPVTYSKGKYNISFVSNQVIPGDALTFPQQTGDGWSISTEYTTSPMIINFTKDVGSTLSLKYNNKLTSKPHTISVPLKYVDCKITLGTNNKYYASLTTIDIPFTLSNTTNIESITFLDNNDSNYTITEQHRQLKDPKTVSVTFHTLPLSSFILQYKINDSDKEYTTDECEINSMYVIKVNNNDPITCYKGNNDISFNIDNRFSDDVFTFKTQNGTGWSINEDYTTTPMTINFSENPGNTMTLHCTNQLTGIKTPITISSITYIYSDVYLGSNHKYYGSTSPISIPFTLENTKNIRFIKFLNHDDGGYTTDGGTINITDDLNILVTFNTLPLPGFTLQYKINNDTHIYKTIPCDISEMYVITVGTNNSIVYTNGDNEVSFTIDNRIANDVFTFKQQSGTGWSIDKAYDTTPMHINFTGTPVSPIILMCTNTLTNHVSHISVNLLRHYCDITLGISNKYYTSTGQVTKLPIKLSQTNGIEFINFLHDEFSEYTITTQAKTPKDTTVDVTFHTLPIPKFTLQYTINNDTHQYQTEECIVNPMYNIVFDTKPITCYKGNNSIPYTLTNNIKDDVFTFYKQSGTGWSIDKDYTSTPLVINLTGYPGSTTVVHYRNELTKNIIPVTISSINYVGCDLSLGFNGGYYITKNEVNNIPLTVSNAHQVDSIIFVKNSSPDGKSYTIKEQTKSITDKTIAVTFNPSYPTISSFYKINKSDIEYPVQCNIYTQYDIVIGDNNNIVYYEGEIKTYFIVTLSIAGDSITIPKQGDSNWSIDKDYTNQGQSLTSMVINFVKDPGNSITIHCVSDATQIKQDISVNLLHIDCTIPLGVNNHYYASLGEMSVPFQYPSVNHLNSITFPFDSNDNYTVNSHTIRETNEHVISVIFRKFPISNFKLKYTINDSEHVCYTEECAITGILINTNNRISYDEGDVPASYTVFNSGEEKDDIRLVPQSARDNSWYIGYQGEELPPGPFTIHFNKNPGEEIMIKFHSTKNNIDVYASVSTW